MLSKIKKLSAKATAFLLTAIMLITVIPTGTFVSAKGEDLLSCTFTLTDGTSVLELDDVIVTLTNKADENDKIAQKTVKGVATFESVLKDGVTYRATVSNSEEYEPVSDFEFVAHPDFTEHNIVITPIDRVNLNGVVKDEDGNPCAGIEVKLSGYTTATKKTDAEGKFTFEAYKGKDYKIETLAADEKYNNASTEIVGLSDAQPEIELELSVKEFKVTVNTTIAETTTKAEETVKYGTNKDIVIPKKDGYRIKSVTINGKSCDIQEDQSEYRTTLNNITSDYEINAEYIRKTYTITFNVWENGKVTYNGDTSITAGGSVEFNESEDSANPTKVTVTAKPNPNYRVSKVIVNGEESTIDDNNNDKEYEKILTVDKNYEFTVEFSLNRYNVTVSVAEDEKGNKGGTATLGEGDKVKINEIVNYGDSETLKINAAEGYRIKSISINNNLVEISGDAPICNNYNYCIEKITEDQKIEIAFEEVKAVEISDDKISNDYYTISFTKDGKEFKPIIKDNTYFISDGVKVKIESSDKSIYKGIYSKDFKLSTENEIIIGEKPVEINEIYLYDSNNIFKWEKITNINIKIQLDKNAPVISNVTKSPNWDFNNDRYTVTADVVDNGVGVDEAYYSNSNEKCDENNKCTIVNGKLSFVTTDKDFNGTYYIFAKDKLGNTTTGSEIKGIEIVVDKYSPRVTKVEIQGDGINSFKDGYFCNSDITVTVSVTDTPMENEDTAVVSGVKNVTLYYGDKSQTVYDVVDGKAVFKIGAGELNRTTFSASVTDKARNESGIIELTKDNTSVNDEKLISNKFTNKAEACTVTIEPDKEASFTDKNNREWYNETGKPKFNVTVKNSYGIKSIKYKLNNGAEKECKIEESTKATTEVTFTVGTVVGENTLTVETESVTNTQSEPKMRTVYVDKEAPTITNFKITKVGDSILEKIINTLSFGIFFNESVNVTVTAADAPEGLNSDVKSITLYYNNSEEYGTQDVDENKQATFTIPKDAIDSEKCYFSAAISATATDNVDNVSNSVNPTVENSGIKSNKLMIETIKPTIEENFTKPVYKDGDKEWYDSDIDFSLTAKDDNSGLAKVEIKINGELIVNEVTNKAIDETTGKEIDNQIFEKEYKLSTNLSTKDLKQNQDGSYVVTAKVTDNAGNVYDEYSKTFYIDKNNPKISGFTFEPVQYNENCVEKTDYGYYFKENTEVTITAVDNDGPSSGLAKIMYYTVDINSGESEKIEKPVNKDGKVSFTIDKNFKGQIYAIAYDNVNHESDRATPNSAILEKPEKHNAENHISLVKPNTSLHTNDGSDLYASNVPVTVTVTDTYSGIRNISWSVSAPYDTDNNQSGEVSVDNSKKISGTQANEWKIISTDNNLVTQMQKVITVNNNSNNIIVTVKMTDRAGNTSENKIELSIDKVSPVIEVTYDNNTADSQYNNIYKDIRKATIKITERNFSSKDVDCKITNTDGVIPSVEGWQEHKNTQSPDQTYYTATVLYSADGDYTFDISCSDLAKNASNKIARHSFTIDRTIPKVSVVYDNNDALNGNYYKADRTATITIVEHNFDSSRVKVTGTASDNGTNLSFPTTGTWSDNGDVHTATINYNFDSRFTFDIAFTDKAGNNAADYKEEEFYVDKTAPSLELSGVEDKSANNGKIAPVITYTDNNIDRNTISVELSGANNGVVDYTTSTENILNGQKYIFADFAKEKKVDDIYTLTATISDMAGNSSKKTITFSANRFGSVYTLDSSLKKLDGKYTNTEQDVVFTETNVDVLDAKSLKLKVFKDGTPKDLKEGTDYTVTHTGGDGKWSQYKYIVKKSMFTDDGKYRVTVYSKDAAGNVNENIEESKAAEISFGIDKTKPVIVPIDFESGQQYAVDVKNVKVEIKDNLVLDNVKIYNGKESDGKEISYKADGETYSFNVSQSNDKQSIMLVAVDAAGNRCELSVKDVLVSTNMFVRWYNNTALFVGSIIGIVVFVTAIAAFIIFGKKRKNK